MLPRANTTIKVLIDSEEKNKKPITMSIASFKEDDLEGDEEEKLDTPNIRSPNTLEFGLKLQKISNNKKFEENEFNDKEHKSEIENKSSTELNKKEVLMEKSTISLKGSLKAAKEKIIKAKRRILFNKENESTKLIGLAAWKSLRNLIELLPKFNGLIEVISEFAHFSSEWKEFFFHSFKELKGKEGEFPKLPGNSDQKLTYLEILILMKYLRPEEIENYIKNFNSAVFKRNFNCSSKVNDMESLSKAACSLTPTVVFTNDFDRNLRETIELKGLSLKTPVNTTVISLLSKSQDQLYKEIEKTSQKGYWMIIENVEILDEEMLKFLMKKLEIERNNQKTSSTWKFWLIYQVNNSIYSEISKKNNEILYSFFGSCSKIFINCPENLKDRLSTMYVSDLQEYEKKAILKQLSNNNLKAMSSMNDLKYLNNLNSLHQEIRAFRSKRFLFIIVTYQ